MRPFIIKILIICLSAPLFFSSCQLIGTGDKSVESDTAVAAKKKYTGVVKHYWENGNLKASINYVDGKREGINKNYSRTGKLISVVPFSNNMINGESKQYYPDGKIHSIITYINNVKNGNEEWYYENGELYQKSNYIYGKLDGEQLKYHKNGKLMCEAVFKGGKPGTGLKEYNPNGTLKEEPYIIVSEQNKLSTTGEYIIKYRLSDESVSVKFYAGELVNGKYFSSLLSPIPTKNGVGTTKLKLNKGSFMMHTVNIIAKKKTHYRNEYITQKKVNIAIENR